MKASTTSVRRIIIRLLLIFVIGLVLLSGSKAWIIAHASASEDFNIYLVTTTFDPAKYVPPAPEGLSVKPDQAAQAGLYLLQLNGPVLDEWKQQLVSVGALLGPYIPQYAFVVKLDQASLARIQGLSFVRWVGAFQPAYKLAPDVDTSSPRSYTIALAPWADASRMRTLALAMDAQVQMYPQNMLVVLGAKQVNQMAFDPDVLWIEPYHLNATSNNVAGGTIMNGSTAWANGYTGSGVTVAVMDTGLDTGNPASMHLDFMNGSTPRVTHISSYPVIYVNLGGGCEVTNPGADDGPSDVESGHGTHVTGSVAGNGARSSGTFKGLAYNATITFQAVEQKTYYSTGCGVPAGYYEYDLMIPTDVRPLLTEVYNWGARVQNDSWEGGSAGVYDQTASYFDDFIFNHPDFAVVVAAGNHGKDTNSDGYVDNGSIDSPATAKNVIAVGATENNRPASTCNPISATGYTGCTYNTLWPSDFLSAPTGTDIISNNPGQMAAFSNRGPAADGRIRPDVVAPGTDIISTLSSLATEVDWGIYNSYYQYMGGTSMASPLTAGAAALVRQFLMSHESIANPSAALIKATLINTAIDIPGYGNPGFEAGAPIPNNSEGWGRVDVGAATSSGRKFMDGATLITGTSFDRQYNVAAGAPFKVTLVWSDYPAAASAGVTLVNDLNLKVTAPDGTTYFWGNVFSGGWSTTGGSADNRNNVENVYIQNPSAGLWRVQIIGQNVPQGPQSYSVVMSGNITSNTPPEAFSKTSPANNAANQPNNQSLNWGTSSGATSYEYCIDTTSNNTCDASWVSTGTNTSVNLSGLALGNHSWQVRAVNAYGNTEANGGAWWSFMVVQSQSKKVYLPLVLKPLPLPGAFNKSAPANGATGQSTSTSLSWGASSTATGYEYCIDTSNNSTCDATWIATAASTSVSLSGLALSTSYYWQVRANSAGGTTYADGGAWWSFTTAAPPSTFTAIADACIMQGYAGTNLGNTADMWAGYDEYLNPYGQIVRSLVKFDLSALSTGTSINSATLHLYYLGYYDYPDYSRTISTYGINSSWAEGSVTWNTQPAIGASYGSSSIVANSSLHWVSFDVTSLIRAWVNGSQANYGILIRGPEVSGSDSSWRSFGTRESGYAPYLSINDTGSGSIMPSQPPFGSKVSDGLAKYILQILTRTSINPLGPVSCLNPLESGNVTKCLLVP